MQSTKAVQAASVPGAPEELGSLWEAHKHCLQCSACAAKEDFGQTLQALSTVLVETPALLTEL